MRVGVLSLCRDRLWATEPCFQSLRDLAGCAFEHYVFDNGSQDGSVEWLQAEQDGGRIQGLLLSKINIGVSRGINKLLDSLEGAFDVIVKYDNDCQLTVDGTLRACCEVALTGDYIASPHIQGLLQPPGVGEERLVCGYRVGIPNLLGGIFMAAPASLYDSYRHDRSNPVWGMDDVNLTHNWRTMGGEVCYLLDYPASHYLTTAGQAERDPDWYSRKLREFHG